MLDVGAFACHTYLAVRVIRKVRDKVLGALLWGHGLWTGHRLGFDRSRSMLTQCDMLISNDRVFGRDTLRVELLLSIHIFYITIDSETLGSGIGRSYRAT